MSIGLYVRYGMYPREPLYVMTGSASNLRADRNRKPNGLNVERVGRAGKTIARLGDIDERAIGLRRDMIHRYLLEHVGADCWVFHRGTEPSGYAYVERNGRVGPGAVVAPTDLGEVMQTALFTAAEKAGVQRVTALVPGSNDAVMDLAGAAGLRIEFPYLLMVSRPFGGASCLFHSPPLM